MRQLDSTGRPLARRHVPHPMASSTVTNGSPRARARSPSKRNRVQSRRTQVSAPPPRAPRRERPAHLLFFFLSSSPSGCHGGTCWRQAVPRARARATPRPPSRSPSGGTIRRTENPALTLPPTPNSSRSSQQRGVRTTALGPDGRDQPWHDGHKNEHADGKADPLLPAAEIPGRPLATRVPGGVLVYGQHPKRRGRPVLPAQPRVNTPGEHPTRPRQPRRVLVQPARPGRRPIRRRRVHTRVSARARAARGCTLSRSARRTTCLST